MPFKYIIIAAAIVLAGCNRPATVETTHTEPDLQAELNSYFKKAYKTQDHKSMKVGALELEASKQVNAFYKQRDLSPIWTSNQQPNEHAIAVLDLMHHAHYYGLDTTNYELEALDNLHQEVQNLTNEDKMSAIIDYELLLSNEAFVFMSHLNQGTLDRDSLWKEPKLDEVNIDLVKTLQQGVENNDVKTAVLAAQPKHFEYHALQQGLQNYVESYPLTDTTFYVKDAKEDSAKAYNKARKVLVNYGYLVDSVAQVDSIFMNALKLYQAHNGLEADGKIGKNTRKALHESNYSRYQRAVASLQRLRWESDTSSDYLRINIPSYVLKIVSKNEVERSFNVVVGSPWTPTPTFSSQLTHFVCNPVWYVPYSISTKEIMPKAMNDSTYLARNGYRVFQGRKQVSGDIDWSQVRAGKYKIRQNKGRGNALGAVKFMFPNEHSVYLHDTNQKRFFKKDVRAYSHGCMRLQDPFDFADYLVLRENHVMNVDSLDTFFVNKERHTVKLDQQLDVHVVYVTCAGTGNGEITFFKDVYGKDEDVVAALFNTPSSGTDK